MPIFWRLRATAAAPRPAVPPSERLSVLTARERETMRMIAGGLSDAEIARKMVVSEHTVKTHVGNVLTKPALRDRVQAVIAAYETGLIVPGGSR